MFVKQRQRGFSLVELAIVLGVFGMIVSGLWGVVSSVKENIKRERAFEQTVLVVQNVRSNFQATADNGLQNIAGGFSAYTSELARRGVIPFDMIRDKTTSPYVVDSPWGRPSTTSGCTGGFCVCDNASTANCDGGTADTSLQTFMIRLQGVPYGACYYLTDRLSGASGPGGLVRTSVNKTAYAGTTFPIPASWAKTVCVTDVSAGGRNIIDFVFRLRRQNF